MEISPGALKLVSELVAVPEGHRVCAFPIVTLGDECVANAKGGGKMAHQRRTVSEAVTMTMERKVSSARGLSVMSRTRPITPITFPWHNDGERMCRIPIDPAVRRMFGYQDFRYLGNFSL